MYEYIKGKLVEKEPNYAAVEANGIAFKIFIPLSTFSALPLLESSLLLYTSFHVKEDAQALYGFLTKHDRDLFDLLNTVSGIGPKTALALVGHLDFATFQAAIANANIQLISKVPGIGKKTAERLIVEMRDKLKKLTKDKPSFAGSSSSLAVDAINALLYLGYNPMQAQKAVQKALDENKKETDLSKLISASLQKI